MKMKIKTDMLPVGAIPLYDLTGHKTANVINEDGKNIIAVEGLPKNRRVLVPVMDMNEDFIKNMAIMLSMGQDGVFVIGRKSEDDAKFGFVTFENK